MKRQKARKRATGYVPSLKKSAKSAGQWLKRKAPYILKTALDWWPTVKQIIDALNT